MLEAARANGIDIPALCYHPDLPVKSNCRLCLVEIAGSKGLLTACSTAVKKGMKVVTTSSKIKKARKINLELIFAQHQEECFDCVYRYNCELLRLAKLYQVKINRFVDRKKNFPVYEFGSALIFDSSKCVDCGNCLDVCDQQVSFLESRQKNGLPAVAPVKDGKRDCIFCGQCLVHCPVGAFEGVGEFEEIEEPLADKNKIVIFQFAPAIRASIGEEFGLPPGTIITDQLVGAIKKLGADYVFDTSVGADFTTYEEAAEFLEKIKTGATPCLTSCCPSWVKYIEFYEPDFIKHLATTRSPQIILGGIIKTYFAKLKKIDPKKITVVSVMPCVAKKYEINRPEVLLDNKLKPVDYVLTTRELSYLFKKRNIDLKTVEAMPADDPLGDPSGAGVIYGASGGVVESALRTAYKMATGKDLLPVDIKAVRGDQTIKKTIINFNGREVKIAAVNGIDGAKKILAEMKANPKAYDGVEVMACPGGCIGGGGEPMPADAAIRAKRAAALYAIDQGKPTRLAHENPAVKKVYQEFLINKEIRHKICHTSYRRKKREVKI